MSLAQGQTVPAVSTLEHPHPCSGLAGLQEEFLTAVAGCLTIRRALSLLRTQLESQSLNSQSTMHFGGVSLDGKDAEK